MAPSAGANPVANAKKVLRQLKARKVDITTFLDDEFKPREPPNVDFPYHWLREGQPDTRVLEPHEYPEGILSKILALVKKTASVQDAQAALRTAVATRKDSLGQIAFVVQVLPRDIDAASKAVKVKTAGETGGRKRAADTTAPQTHASKRANLTDQNTNSDTADKTSDEQETRAAPVAPSVITRIQDTPEPLGTLLSRLQKMRMQNYSYLTPAVRAYFNEKQTESDLYTLLLTTMAALHDHDDLYDHEHSDLHERLSFHAQRHWIHKRNCDRASMIYEDMHREQGVTLSDELKKLYQEPLPCCPGVQAAQPPESTSK